MRGKDYLCKTPLGQDFLCGDESARLVVWIAETAARIGECAGGIINGGPQNKRRRMSYNALLSLPEHPECVFLGLPYR